MKDSLQEAENCLNNIRRSRAAGSAREEEHTKPSDLGTSHLCYKNSDDSCGEYYRFERKRKPLPAPLPVDTSQPVKNRPCRMDYDGLRSQVIIQ